jgi:hypothetical protein
MRSCSYFVSQSSEFCRHNPLCCFSTSVYFCKRIFRYRLSPETFGYSLVLRTVLKGKGKKVKLSLCLTKHDAMKTYWGSGGITLHILDLGNRWRWVVSFTSRPFTSREIALGTHWIGGWVDPRVDLDAVVKRKRRLLRNTKHTVDLDTCCARYARNFATDFLSSRGKQWKHEPSTKFCQWTGKHVARLIWHFVTCKMFLASSVLIGKTLQTYRWIPHIHRNAAVTHTWQISASLAEHRDLWFKSLSLFYISVFYDQTEVTYFQTKKVNVELSLCLTKHHAIKAYWASGGIAPLIL